jgi:hypothetical protein
MRRSQVQGLTMARTRKRVSTKTLAAAGVAAVGASVAAVPAANALLPQRSSYLPTQCTAPATDFSGNLYGPGSMSNYGHAGATCGGGGNGYACITQKDSHGNIVAQSGWYKCVNSAGNSVRSIEKKYVKLHRAVFRLDGEKDTKKHEDNGVAHNNS